MENKDKVPLKRRMPEIPQARMPGFWKGLSFWIILGVFIFYMAHSSSLKVKEKVQKITRWNVHAPRRFPPVLIPSLVCYHYYHWSFGIHVGGDLHETETQRA